MRNPQEEAEAKALSTAIQDKKVACFEYVLSIIRYDDKMMQASGYGSMTKGEAIIKILTRKQQEIEKMVQAHERKWP